jgi:hypothetical protein
LTTLAKFREQRSRDFARIASTVERGQRLTGGAPIAVHQTGTRRPSMFKITRSTQMGTMMLALSGRVGSEHLPDLRRFLEEPRESAVVLNLGEVTLVDVDVVRFLIVCETQAIRLADCPGYIREWMAREKPPLE